MFVLRESARLALFRSLTVPLMGSVPSCCCRFTLRCTFFNFLGLAVLADASSATAFAIVSHQLILFVFWLELDDKALLDSYGVLQEGILCRNVLLLGKAHVVNDLQ